MGTLLARFLFGAAAGLAAWAVMEPFAPTPDTLAWARWEQIFIFAYCGAVGLVVGGYDGFVRGGKIHTLRGLGLGLGLGVVGGVFGYSIGGRFVYMLLGPDPFNADSNFALEIFARTVLFTCLGLCLGAGAGASSLTKKRTIQGALGGAIGGAVGGACFDIIGTLVSGPILTIKSQQQGEVGGPSRGIAFTLMAAMIALFIGLVERLTRSAWLRLNLGRNEGKEWSIDAVQTFIGRDERASIPLMGDPNVAPIHATITRQGHEYILADAGSPMGTGLNGQRVSQAVLVPGSIIQIGNFALQFLVKGTPAPAMAPEAYRAPVMPIGGYAPTPLAPTYQPSTAAKTVAFPAATAGLSFSVLALDGPVGGQRFPVAAPLEIGREGAGVRLADPNASRRHASISPAPTGVVVSDLGSTNGTFLNGQRIATAEAHAGDVVTIGGTNFRVEAGAGS
jgi:pSer/pThr/pTyr-binding forkhead associated (FHA) protein